MDAHEQFMFVLAIAAFFVVAAPSVVYLFEWRRPRKKEEERRPTRGEGVVVPELEPQPA